ncbi:hypothetical protein BV25DRAFT_1823461 [Artomyces pyxidatus]|uniref:Uncharacterized protein n=1 Tax=Artomyces pyxidatus TaxID=48021 RepID=A0ACB8T7N6_9AGAM|nr:hypothetical protein BV25DRAFT_1823461 [Artomyces pyxidatus]
MVLDPRSCQSGLHPRQGWCSPSRIRRFPRRQDVDSSNILRMSRLQGEVRTFLAKDGGTAGDDQRKKLLDNLMAPEKLEVTVGSQVMLIKNIDETLVNGSMGVVQRFSDPTKYAAESEDPEFTVVEKPSSSVGKKNTSKSPPQLMPVVDFSVPGGGKRTVLVMPESWKIELPNGEIQASRQQVTMIYRHLRNL